MFICINSGDGDFYRMVLQTTQLIERFVIEMRMPTIIALDDCPPKRNWVGLYCSSHNEISIDKDYWCKNKNENGIKRVIHTLCHEIGHAVHFVYLADKAQYLERAHRGSRSYHCNLNSKESFAECFADYCFAVFENDTGKIAKSKRLSKMGRILKNIIVNGYEVLVRSDCGLFMRKNGSLAQNRNSRYSDAIVEGKNKLINPFADKLRQGFYENLLNCRISILCKTTILSHKQSAV